MDLEFGQVSQRDYQVPISQGGSSNTITPRASHLEVQTNDGMRGQPSVGSTSPKSSKVAATGRVGNMEPANIMLELLGISPGPSRNIFFSNSGTTEEEMSKPNAGSEQFQDAHAYQLSHVPSEKEAPSRIQRAIVPYQAVIAEVQGGQVRLEDQSSQQLVQSTVPCRFPQVSPAHQKRAIQHRMTYEE
jgi:hypothetical protein